MVNRHNRTRQFDLGLARAFQVKEWSMRSNTTILGMCVNDAFMLYRGSCGATPHISCNDFFSDFSEQLIENTHDAGAVTVRSRLAPTTSQDVGHMAAISGVGTHLSSTKRFRTIGGRLSKARLQRKCRMCGMKTQDRCSTCRDNDNTERHFCAAKTGRNCFAQHTSEVHGLSSS